jgi:arginyl-tRNA synthetase
LDIREELFDILINAQKAAVENGELPDCNYPEIKIEYPRESKFGDYATPFALECAKLIKKSPMETGGILKKYIAGNSLVGEVDVVKPGFVNIFISYDYLFSGILKALKENHDYGKRVKALPERYNIEFVSANPTGPLNVVSARAAAIGDTIANLIEANGDEADREFYVNDFGNQVNLLGVSVIERIKEIKGEKFSFPDDGYHGEYVKEIASWIVDNYSGELDRLADSPELIEFASRKAIEYNVTSQKKDLEDFNVIFREWFHESSLHASGDVLKTYDLLEKNKFIYEEEGKKFFKSSDFGDDKDRVVIRDDGRPTYLLADIAYHNNKLARGYKKVIDIWGPDHHGYIARLSGAVEALGYGKDKFKVLIAQQVNLIMDGEAVKMSKRLGNFSTMRELIEEVGVDVSRYFFIMRSMDSHLDFDLNLAKKNSSENPVFYLQYAHARICSIFREAEKRKIDYKPEAVMPEILNTPLAVTLMKLIAKFPEEIYDAGEAFEPHRIASFLIKVAQSYHRFYTEHRILGDDAATTQAYLLLSDSARIVIRNGLKILGVSAPESM